MPEAILSYRRATMVLLGATALLLVLWGAGDRLDPHASQAQSRPRPAPAGRSPLATGPDADLNIVFTAQVAGWIEPCG